MSRTITINRFFTIPVHELYGYFIDPVLIERWCAPEGMSLKVPAFDARVGGKYRYVHSNGRGSFVANGHFRKLVQNQLIQMVDDEIIDPTGKIVGKKITCDISFTGFGNGSGVAIRMSGFETAAMADECETGWSECFDKLQDLVKDSGLRQFHAETDSTGRQLH